MKKTISILIYAIIAGILIGLGGTLFLLLKAQDKMIFGTFMFGIGLFFICVYQFKLYTGAVCYIPENKLSNNLQLITIAIGNFIGTYVIAKLLLLTRIKSTLKVEGEILTTIKLNDTVGSILILSIFCGLLIYFAVYTYKNISLQLVQVLAVFICVSGFIICNFEHSVANMYYFSVSSTWSLKAFGYMLIMILGNTIGGNIIPVFNILYNKLNKTAKN